MTDKSVKYRTEIQQMMFVSGETAEPSAETTTLIEQIVQQQVQEMLRECTALATRRGSRSISTDDLMMLIRHDRAKISRLRTFLQWKDVRKTAKDSDDKGGAADDLAGDDLGVDITSTAAPNPATKTKASGGSKKARVDLVWDVQSFFAEIVPARDDEEDEEEEEMNYATLQRLKNADERTKNMTREEYVHWSDCRQASFTFRKGKRFREWAGFGTITDTKPNDDIIDILGFLTFEIVQTLTEEALKVKNIEDAHRKVAGGDVAAGGQSRKRKRESGLFDPPEEAREPVGPQHVREGFRRLQRTPIKGRAMLNFTGLLQRTSLKLVCCLLCVDIALFGGVGGGLTTHDRSDYCMVDKTLPQSGCWLQALWLSNGLAYSLVFDIPRTG
ncbi:TFIID-18kDa-domain-containing protein [Saccharata proteae CBS 121410]|uniref:TFIID-18kDa-domain-containing protein n=1 Tax=Saccharata proteae CBS 121410 TaxID=1314787 RepID=A0A9P4HN09_9PEZI|nr:TFIID-18kDa-domain-containing protein [Saccharata proteae CBS 121410]